MKRTLGTVLVALSAALLLAAPGALAGTSYNYAAAPTGTHLVQGTPNPWCELSGLAVTCNSYEIAGVGHTNAHADLAATYAATVDCNNPGANKNNPIESHTTSFSSTTSTGRLSPKNGRLTVPSLSVSPKSSDLAAATYCPNPNWKAVIRDGTLHLVSFTYTVKFDGFVDAFLTVTGP